MSSPWRHAAASIETSGHLEEALILLVIPAFAGMTNKKPVVQTILDRPRLAGR
jgi:hypothetical protein